MTQKGKILAIQKAICTIYDTKKSVLWGLRTKPSHRIVHSADSSLLCSKTTLAVTVSVQFLGLLTVDIRRGRGVAAVALCHPRGLRGRDLVPDFGSRDGVAPVGRDHSAVRVNDTKSRRKTTNHAARSIWSTRVFVNTLDENVVLRGRLCKLQNDLVRPVAHVRGQGLVTCGVLLVTLNRDFAIKLLPELERDRCDFDVANLVPCDKCVVQLLSRVERSEELRLCDKVSS